MKTAIQRGSAVAENSSGAPRKTSERSDRLLRRAAKQEGYQSLSELNTNITNDRVSKRLVQRRLKEAGIKKWIANRDPGPRQSTTGLGTGSRRLDR